MDVAQELVVHFVTGPFSRYLLVRFIHLQAKDADSE